MKTLNKEYSHRMTKQVLKFLAPLLLIVVLAGCGTKTADNATTGAASGGAPLRITATTGMIADLVKNIGGEHVDVTSLMGPGVDPHLYKATQSDIGKLGSADMIFYNGLHLEGKMGEVLEKLGKNKPVVAVAEKISPEKLLRADGDNPDPHIWFDVSLWMLAADAVRDELIKKDAQNKAVYEKNHSEYSKELQALHEDAKNQLATVPKTRRVLITAHDAFGYFGRAYDVEVVGLQGISTASEYGLKDVQRLVNLISQRKIKAVFVESSIPRRPIEAVVQGCKAKGHDVKIGGTLYSDAMGAAETEQGTYIGMVRHNVQTIVEHLK
jgi:manganese/zinc/iron transport system substrate-binding protein